MAVQTRPTPTPAPVPQQPALRLVECGPPARRVDLLTFVVGNVVFWTLWAAISVTADPWYFWPLVPLAGSALVLAAHLRHMHREAR